MAAMRPAGAVAAKNTSAATTKPTVCTSLPRARPIARAQPEAAERGEFHLYKSLDPDPTLHFLLLFHLAVSHDAPATAPSVVQ